MTPSMRRTAKVCLLIVPVLHFVVRADVDWGSCRGPACTDVVMLYTAELRGGVIPTDGLEYCDPELSASCFGGHARRAAYIDQRRRALSLDGISSVLFDLGGSAWGGPLFMHPVYGPGGAIAELMNAIPYDFALFSSSDFLTSSHSQEGRDALATSYANRTSPWLLANVNFNEPFRKLQDNVLKYKIITTSDGNKIGFIGMFPHESSYGYSFGPGVVDLDENGVLNWIKRTNMSKYANLQFELAQLKGQIAELQGDWATMDHCSASLYQISSLISSDVIAASDALRREHPDVRAVVLLAGRTLHRDDQLYWLLEFGPFDAIIVAKDEPLEVYKTSAVGTRRVLLGVGATQYGLGELRMRFNGQGSVEKFELTADKKLGADVPSLAGLQELSTKLYEATRQRNTQVCGSITQPLTGTHRLGEFAPSLGQCYYTDCPASDVVGKAMLWEARRAGHKADLAYSNLGSFRAALRGTDGVVRLGHTVRSLAFANRLVLFQIKGEHLYEMLQRSLDVDVGFIGAGFRLAFHEPCWKYVNHSDYSGGRRKAPGNDAELSKCLNTGVASFKVGLIDVQVEYLDFDSCADLTNCNNTVWRTLEKATTYTMVSTNYVAGIMTGLMKPLGVSFATESEVLCEYIRANSPVNVAPWTRYRDRGLVQYETAEDGWAAGNRVPSVKTTVPFFESMASCPDGMYIPPGQPACIPCELGRHSDDDYKRSRCVNCSIGTFADAMGLKACVQCPLGRSNDVHGSTECSCDRSFYEGPDNTCEWCEAGYYCDGHSGRLKCPANSFTLGGGNSRREDCICDGGYVKSFLNEADILIWYCLACPVGFWSRDGKSCDIDTGLILSVFISFAAQLIACLFVFMHIFLKVRINEISRHGDMVVITTLHPHGLQMRWGLRIRVELYGTGITHFDSDHVMRSPEEELQRFDSRYSFTVSPVVKIAKSFLLYRRGSTRSFFTNVLSDCSSLWRREPKGKVFQIKVLDDSRVELLAIDGSPLRDADVESSMGHFRPVFPDYILTAGHHIPRVIPAIFWGLVPWAISYSDITQCGCIRKSWYVVIAIGSATLLAALVAFLLRIKHFYWQKTHLHVRMLQYLQRCQHLLRYCDRGPERAVAIGDLVKLLRTFKDLIQDRNARYLSVNILLPLTRRSQSSFAEFIGPKRVEFFVSHYWGSPVQHFVATVSNHARCVDGVEDWRSIPYWICFCSVSQWHINKELGEGRINESSFFLALHSASCRATCIVLDESTRPLARSWCLFEILQTYKKVQRTAAEGKEFEGLKFCTERGTIGTKQESETCFDVAISLAKRIAVISVENARATYHEDEEMIVRLVQEHGGMDQMNHFIRSNMLRDLQSAKRDFLTDMIDLEDLLVLSSPSNSANIVNFNSANLSL